MRGIERLQEIIGKESDKLDGRMDFWVENFGSQVASWLAWSFKRQFKRDGAVDFVIPRKTPTPPWMRVALEALRRRPNWSVQTIDMSVRGERRFRVTWHCWGTFRKDAVRVTTVSN